MARAGVKETSKVVTSKSTKPKSSSTKSSSAKSNKKLFIVESPAKARTIAKFLGKDYIVKASVGHIRDLAKKGGGKKGLGIDIDNNFTPTYQVIPGKEKTVKELKTASSKVATVFLAPDQDREGESIAWHLKEALGLADDMVKRVSYGAITKRDVQEAINNPRTINMDLVNAQQGRRILDRLVGFNLSPFLWEKIARDLSAGRVQSVAVRLVVIRELEIKAFKPEEYWRVTADLSPELEQETSFSAELTKWNGEKFVLGAPMAAQEKSVRAITAELEKSDFIIKDIREKKTSRKASPPFITSTLQQAASNYFGMGPSRTMSIAQRLYEGLELGEYGHVGLITYMRTDSVRVVDEAINEARALIKARYAPEYLPSKANFYGTKKSAQDAHEAIRPTSVNLHPELVKNYLDKDLLRLYTLIWQRFIASQMMPARYNLTTVIINAGSGVFEARGRVVLFDGFTTLFNSMDEGEAKETEALLPSKLQKDQSLTLNKLVPKQHFTKAPNRYTEAGLVKALEKEGIGRPSTYAPIIKTIKDRGYVSLEKKSFKASELGIAVTKLLEDNFPDIMDFKFTANMENQLDEIEEGRVNWQDLIASFFGDFSKKIDYATQHAEALKGQTYDGEETCPICKSSLVIRYSKSGAFLGCSNYPECKGLLPLPNPDSEAGAAEQESLDCPNCGRPMVVKSSRYGQKFYACTGYPECKTTKSYGETPDLPEVEEQNCENCGSKMLVKMGRRGAFLACSAYPKCKNTIPIKDGKVVKLPKVEAQNCENCGSKMLVKMGRRGAFLACSAYPKCKNAKPIASKDSEA